MHSRIILRSVLHSRRLAPISRRWGSSGSDNEALYEEEIQKRQIKPVEFYEEHAKNRDYFFHVDLLGRLFLEDILPKNIATSLKSSKFLDFFFTMLRPNHTGRFGEYAWVSPCGKEMNFVRPADTPIVFDKLEDGMLIYGATLAEPFDPEELGWDEGTDRLYHRVRQHKHLAGHNALVRSHLAVQLSQDFVFLDEDIYLRWDGKEHLIRKSNS